jgi:predicted MFS family arabinose efflux permease
MTSIATDGAASLGEWRKGWIVVLAALIGIGVSQLHYITFGFMMTPMERELGWSRTEITTATLIFSVLIALSSPIAGRLLDRARELAIGLPAIAVYCLLLASLSQVGPHIGTWWALWAVIACISPFAAILFWTTVVARRFEKQRGLALAIALCGTGVATSTMPMITNEMIEAYGWRGTYLRLGLVSGIVLLPLTIIALVTSSDRASTAARQANPTRISWRQAFASSRFLKIAFAGSVMSMTATLMPIHFIPLLAQKGVAGGTAAAALSLVGVGAIVGRLVTGVLLDRSRGPLIGTLAFALPIIPVAMLLGLEGSTSVTLAIGLLLGLSFGAEIDIVSYFTARYFGVRSYASMFGAVFALMGALAGVGPWLAGLAHDATGSYTLVLLTVAPAAALAAFALFTLGPYPSEAEREHG